MATIAIVGDGPAGLSAALFLAKNGQTVTVYGDDKTAMHSAHLYNYLGVPDVSGSDFQEIARQQVEGFGVEIRQTRVEAVEPTMESFLITSEDGETGDADYLILAEGRHIELAKTLELDLNRAGGIAVDSEFRASLPRVYAAGRSVRPTRSQAIISAGAGAIAALDILAEVTGEDFTDWDSPPD